MNATETTAKHDRESPRPSGDGCRARLLMIEDDLETASDVIQVFRDQGYEVTHEANGIDGLARARDQDFDLILLDRMLPGMDGLSILAQLRRDAIRCPVLVLSALGDVNDRVLGLKEGGDDYLSKPFALTELAVRVEALLRRSQISRETVLKVGDLVLDLIDREAHRGDRRIKLLMQEFKLLDYMMRRPGQTLSRDMLLADIWHYRFQTRSNLVDVHIGRLRRKIEAAGEAPMIHTVSGVGFKLCAPN